MLAKAQRATEQRLEQLGVTVCSVELRLCQQASRTASSAALHASHPRARP